MRALAKEPADRYQSAAAFDADLETVARGGRVAAETAEAATMVLAGEATAATQIARRPPPPQYEPPKRGRPLWPWLLAIGTVLAVLVLGLVFYDSIQRQLRGEETVAVPYVVGLQQANAVNKIEEKGLTPQVRPVSNSDVEEGVVFTQTPTEGTHVDKETVVTIDVSSGKPEVTIPSVVGQTDDDAVAELTRAGLNAQVVEVNSDRDVGTVTAQNPGAGTVVVEGTQVRINVSRGPKPVTVPNVVGLPYDQAASELQRNGFSVSRIDEESDQAAGIVTSQTPSGRLGGLEGIDRDRHRLQGPVDVRGARRHDAGLRHRPDDVGGCGLPNACGVRGHRRSDVRRHRDLPGSGRRHAGKAQRAHHAVRRTVRQHHHDDSVSARVRVAVLAGGRSSEHDISVASARSVVDALDPERYETVVVEIDRGGRWELASDAGELPETSIETLPVVARSAPAATLGQVDVVLPILHGPFGEDGTVQGLLELAGVPYVGAGVAASALCMDKDLFKAVLRDRGIPVAQNVTLREGDAPEHPFPYPVFVKPARLGSSVGISKVTEADELAAAVELARRHDDKVLIEEGVQGVEVECGVLGNRDPIASVVGEIVAHADWYDYSAKYDEGGMELVIPARITPEADDRVRQLAVDSFVATECEGMARIDFFVRTDGEVIVNEINTIPGFTSTSVYAKLFEAAGIGYADLLDRLIALALERHERRARLLY